MSLLQGNPKEKRQTSRLYLLFVFVFTLNLLCGLGVQLLLPKILPALHLGDGLFIGDSRTFHENARKLAGTMGSSDGFPSSFTHTVGRIEHVFAFFYRFYPYPLSVLPLQSVLQAMAAILGAGILRRIGAGGRASWWGGLLVGWNPWCWEWSTQIHRDGFFITGVLSILVALLPDLSADSQRRGISSGHLLFGICMIFLSRFYWLEIFKVMFLMFGLIGITLYFVPWTSKIRPSWILCFFGILLCAGFQALDRRWSTQTENRNKEALREAWKAGNSAGDNISVSFESPFVPNPYQPNNAAQPRVFPRWQSTSLPWLDYLGYRIYRVRQTQILAGGRSLVDEEHNLESISRQLLYLPRALQLALFAPFPSEIFTGPVDGRKSPVLRQARTWPQTGSGFRSSHAAAKIAPYLGSMASLAMFGIFWMLWCEKTRSGTLLAILFCLPPLALLGEIMPNLGTLVRHRYAFWILLVAIGVTGLAKIFRRLRDQKGSV